MSHTDNVVPIGETAQDKIARQVLSARLLPELRTITGTHLKKMIQSLFDITDDAMFKLAESIGEDMDQNIYFESMRSIRLKQKLIAERFFRHITDTFDKCGAESKPQANELQPEIDYETLELVSESDLEVNLAAENLIHKIRNLYTPEISAAEKRFSWLLGLEKNEVRGDAVYLMPFGPESIVTAFEEGMDEVELTLQIKLIMFKLFDLQCIDYLDNLFHEVNTLFVDNGVFPVIKPAAKATQDSKLKRQTQTQPGSVPVSSQTSPMWNELQKLIHAQRDNPYFGSAGYMPPDQLDREIQASPSSAQYSTNVISTEDILSSLNELQLNAINEVPEGGAHAVGTYLRVQLHTDNSDGKDTKPINPIDNDLIDIVCLIFEYILDDRNLPSAAKASIGRLQIPMLKVAIIDKDFFSMNGHPARNLLNRLASSAVGIDESEGLDNPYLSKIQEITESVLNYFKNDITLFDDLNAEFDRFLEEQKQAEQEVKDELLKEQHDKEELVLARTWVKETLAQHLVGKEMPMPVVEIITGAWKDVMLKTYLEHGEDSQLWRTQIRFIDILRWSIEPKQAKMDREKFGTIIQHLMTTLRQGLSSIDSDQLEIARIFSILEPYHMASMHGVDVNQLPFKDSTSNGRSSVSTGLEINEKVILEDIVLQDWEHTNSADQIDDEYLELARHLEMGKWVEFKAKDGSVRRAKLAWKSELLGEYTFLNWKFDVVADKSLLELAEDLRQGHAKVVDEVPLMDRALSAVVSNLIPKSSG